MTLKIKSFFHIYLYSFLYRFDPYPVLDLEKDPTKLKLKFNLGLVV